MKRITLVVALLLSALLPNAHAAQMADLVLGPQPSTAVAFRNANFALHFGGIETDAGLPNGVNAPRGEYLKPWDFARIQWLMKFAGETVTAVPGTNYIDAS